MAKKRKREYSGIKQAREDVLEAMTSNYQDDGIAPEEREREGKEGAEAEGGWGQTSEEEPADVDSETELQVALESGLLKPGLNVELPMLEKPIYDADSIKRLTTELREHNLEWVERMDVTCEPLDSSQCVRNDDLLEAIESNDLVNDDFKRELVFFGQAQAAVAIALPKLRQLGVKTERPADFFAEMAKSDEHMKKVRERLLAKSKTAERVEKIRKLRDAKKFAKKVQIEKEKTKLTEKKQMIDKTNLVRKGKSKDLSFLHEDSLTGNKTIDLTDRVVTKALMKNAANATVKRKSSTKIGEMNKKRNKLREAKDLKYGYGGKKRNIKRNDKKSTNAFGKDTRRQGSTSSGFKRKQPTSGSSSKRAGKGKKKK